MKNGPMFSPSPSPSYPPSPINKRLFLYTARIMPTKGFTTWVGFSHTTFQFASEETHDSHRDLRRELGSLLALARSRSVGGAFQVWPDLGSVVYRRVK